MRTEPCSWNKHIACYALSYASFLWPLTGLVLLIASCFVGRWPPTRLAGSEGTRRTPGEHAVPVVVATTETPEQDAEFSCPTRRAGARAGRDPTWVHWILPHSTEAKRKDPQFARVLTRTARVNWTEPTCSSWFGSRVASGLKSARTLRCVMASCIL